MKRATLHDCPIAVTAGRAYFPQLLRTMAVAQSSPSATNMIHNDWPSIFIAKLDIQEFEFKTLSAATEWLQRRPPCYLILEVMPPDDDDGTHPTQMPALFELLQDAGYNAAWRALDSVPQKRKVVEFPGRTAPFWNGTDQSLTQAWRADMQGRKFWQYKDWIIGFQDEQECLDRLLQPYNVYSSL